MYDNQETFIVKNKQSCVNEDCVHRIKQKINIIEFLTAIFSGARD